MGRAGGAKKKKKGEQPNQDSQCDEVARGHSCTLCDCRHAQHALGTSGAVEGTVALEGRVRGQQGDGHVS